MSKELDRRIQEVAHSDKKLITAIKGIISLAKEHNFDVVTALEVLDFSLDELRVIYTSSARFPEIFLSAIVWRFLKETKTT